MTYFDSSYTTLKGLCTNGYQVISEIDRFAKPAVVFIYAKVLENPISALIGANLALIFLAKKVSHFVSPLLKKMTLGFLSEKLTAPIIGLGIFAGGNYVIYTYASLKLSIELSLIIPTVTFSCVMLFFRILNPPLAPFPRCKQAFEQKNQSLRILINKDASLLNSNQKQEICQLFDWWNPEKNDGLEFCKESQLLALHKAILNRLNPQNQINRMEKLRIGVETC